MSNDLDDFIARLHGSPDAATYHASRQEWLARLDEFQTPFPVTSEEEYRKADTVRRILSHLACYTFNTNHPANDRVWALESAWGKALVSYNRRLLLKDPSAKLIARYLLWSYVFASIDPRAAFVLARRHGVLRKVTREDRGAPRLCVIGLERAVGDNIFTVDRRGREHRRYGRTIGRQAFPVCRAMPWSGADADAFMSTIPELDPTYNVTDIGDFKHASRGSAFRRNAQHQLHQLLASVKDGDLRPGGIEAVPAPEASVPRPAQLELLAAA